MKFPLEKLAKTLFFILILVISVNVLTVKIPESKYMQQTMEHLEKSQNTVMTFSGTTITTSLAISALPDDFASPLAETVSDLNTYFIFMHILYQKFIRGLFLMFLSYDNYEFTRKEVLYGLF